MYAFVRRAATLLSLTGLALAASVAGAADPPRVRVNTSLGSFVVELNPERAPLTVEHFLSYVDEGHYAGTIFHRVVHNFVAQGGGFTVDYEEKPTPRGVVNESGNGLPNLRGTVGIARATEPHSARSQFYINLVDNPDLDPRPSRWGYAVFGTIVEGLEIIDELGYRPTTAAGPFERDVPIEPIIIHSVERVGE